MVLPRIIAAGSLLFLLSQPAYAIRVNHNILYPEPGTSEIWKAEFGQNLQLAEPDEETAAEVKAANRCVMQSMHAAIPAYTGAPDTDFAAAMIPHHQGAVEMAEIELMYGRDPQMRAMAEYILKNQKVEITLMRQWLDTYGYIYKDPASPSIKANEQAMERMHHAMMINYTGNADVDFARGMIPHHQGALDMAGVEFSYGRDKIMRKLAWNIFASQTQEIGVLKRWLEAHGAQTQPSPKADHDHASH